MQSGLHSTCMLGILQRITDFFVITVGITPPKPGQEKKAALFIGALMLLILAIIVGGVMFFSRFLH